jgi:hypothetical protein
MFNRAGLTVPFSYCVLAALVDNNQKCFVSILPFIPERRPSRRPLKKYVTMQYTIVMRIVQHHTTISRISAKM